VTAGLTAALVVAAALGISFRTTRGIGIASCAALVFLYPALAVLVLIVVGVFAFDFLRKR
jgi:hypothetical protein